MKRLIWKALHLVGLDSAAASAHIKLLNLYRHLRAQLRWYIKHKNQMAPDGLPFPPPGLAFLVTGMYDVEYFYQNGLVGARSIQDALAQNGLDINDFSSVLDFGCGCGRIMRHWSRLSGPRLYGTDYNPRLIEWCQDSLAFAEFGVNKLSPRLDYHDDQFDFIYALSVFTHLDEALQHSWIDELARVLKPGGFLLITVHGEARFYQLSPAEIQQFQSGRLVLRKVASSGTNLCSAFHPEEYVRHHLAGPLQAVDFIPSGARDGAQDIYLFQSPGIKE